MSGGVDSLTIIFLNRQDFPLDHSDSIQDGLFEGENRIGQ